MATYHESSRVGDMFICPPSAKSDLRMSTVLAVGFGTVVVTRDGETVWQGDDESVWIRRFEKRAAIDEPGHDWRVYFHGPLSGAEYQRVGPKQWALVKTNQGFA